LQVPQVLLLDIIKYWFGQTLTQELFAEKYVVFWVWGLGRHDKHCVGVVVHCLHGFTQKLDTFKAVFEKTVLDP
jgi:hypothetical protein